MEDNSFAYEYYLSTNTRNISQKTQRGIEKAPNKPKKSKKSKLDDQCMEWYEFKKSTTYYWSTKENRSYINFLNKHRSLVEISPIERKIKKVNLQMSKYVKTRTPTQCHTHHQKMMTRYGNIESIIDNLSSNLDGQRKKQPKMAVKDETSSYIQEPCIKKSIDMKSASEILAIEPLIHEERPRFELIDLLNEIYEPAYTARTKDLMEWIDVEAFLM